MSTNKRMAALLIAGLLASGAGFAAAPPMSKEPVPARTPSSAQPDDYGATVSNKLGSALSNIFLGWMELPKNIINTTNQYNLAWGMIGGPIKGALHSGGRMMTGIFDLVTFAVPTQPIAKPNYVWEDMGTETRYGTLVDPKAVGPER